MFIHITAIYVLILKFKNKFTNQPLINIKINDKLVGYTVSSRHVIFLGGLPILLLFSKCTKWYRSYDRMFIQKILRSFIHPSEKKKTLNIQTGVP